MTAIEVSDGLLICAIWGRTACSTDNYDADLGGRARTANGDITVVTSRGPVRAETVNGDVDARMTTLEGTDSVIVKTLNGEAWAFVPEDAGLSVDIGITNGSLVTDFPTLVGYDVATP